MLTNAVIDSKIPQEGTLQRAVEVDIDIKARKVHILPHAIMTGNEDANATL